MKQRDDRMQFWFLVVWKMNVNSMRGECFMICTQLKLNLLGFTMYSISSDLSEIWCLKENKNVILKRTERVTVRAMCGQKIVDKKTEE